MRDKSFTFLGQAGKQLAAGAIAATLAAVVFTGVAQAGNNFAPKVTTTVTPDGTKFLWDYKVGFQTTPPSNLPIGAIFIPELHKGHLVQSGAENGWDISEALGNTPFNADFTAGAFFELIRGTGTFLGFPNSLDFTFTSDFGGELLSNVEVAAPFNEGSQLLASFAPERVAATVPEPGTLALFGSALLGLVAWRRRQRG
jgi:hypothetical protein